MKTVEVKEINLMLHDFYNHAAYPSDGLFLVNDMATVDYYTLLVIVKNNCVVYITEGVDIDLIEEKKEEKVQTQVSEDLFLKALSLAINKDESYKD